jgi:molybdate-binding protein/DNA-binding XRE family transcriptional regulator
MTAGFGNASGMDTRVRTAVKAMRLRLEIQQRDLAKAIAVSRQTLSSIEAGETVPSTQIALALARELRCRVEDLFSLRGDGQVLEAEFVPESDRSFGDGRKARVSLGWVGKRWVARLLETDEALALGTPADGIASLSKGKNRTQARVHPLRDLESLHRNLLVAGCDPALGLLGRHLEERFHGPRLHWIEKASRPALEELALGRVHIAGMHLLGEGGVGENVVAVRERFASEPMVLVTLASWEQGFVSRPGHRYKSAADVERRGTRVVARESGAGAQELLERLFRKAGRKFENVAPVAVARGHRAVAQMVAMGVGDVGVATRSAAASFGLHFEPLAEARFDLVFPAALASDGRVRALLDCLSDGRFRQDLGGMTGYRTARTGEAPSGVQA